MTAARDYKAIIARLSAAAEDLRARDAERAGQLRGELGPLHHDVEQASGRAALTRFGVDLHWEVALEALWPESWMKLRPKPGADPRRPAAPIDDLDAGVEKATDAVLEAVRRGRFRFPGR